jgi:hypothetical protein
MDMKDMYIAYLSIRVKALLIRVLRRALADPLDNLGELAFWYSIVDGQDVDLMPPVVAKVEPVAKRLPSSAKPIRFPAFLRQLKQRGDWHARLESLEWGAAKEASAVLAVPFLTTYDPPGASEGTLDPLGLYQIADQLATRLVPAVRERMQRIRFLTAMAIGGLVTEGLDGGPDQAEPQPFLVWEWLVVEAIVRTLGDDPDV